MRPKSARRSILAALALAALFLLGALPLILTGKGNGTNRGDQDDYHLPVIREFAAQWPHPYLRDYNAAMTPAYHLLMAGVYRATQSVLDLKLLNALLTVGLLVTLALAVARSVGPLAGIVLCLPFLCSQYIFTSGVWLVPHNPAWWCVLLVLLISLRRRVDWITYVGGGLCLLALVLLRQVHLWAAAPLLVAAWLGSEKQSEVDRSPKAERSPAKECQWTRVAWMALCVIPAVAAVAFFIHLWHGTVPPMQRTNVAGGNPAVPAFILALTGIYMVFFATVFPWKAAFTRARRQRTISAMSLGLVIGLVAGVLPQTNYDVNAGRWGGLWHVVRHLPMFDSRSILIIGLAALGGTLVALWIVTLPSRPRWIILAAFVGFIAANCAASQAWQRYDDPFLLMIFPLMAIRLPKTSQQWNAPHLAGPIALALLLAATTILTLR